MKALGMLLVLAALATGSKTQIQPPPPVPAPLSILVCNWIGAARSQGSSGDQEQKAKDRAIDQQIALANRAAEDGGNTGSGEAQSLGARKQNQVALIPLPTGVVKGYLYKVQVRNVGDRIIKRLHWSYVFTDVLTQKEIVRHGFFSQVRIHPGQEKKLSAFTRGAPPAVINVKEMSKGNKPWGESVVIDDVEFADGTLWKPATVDQLKPANN